MKYMSKAAKKPREMNEIRSSMKMHFNRFKSITKHLMEAVLAHGGEPN